MISSYNEWGSLKRVIVGDTTWANWPTQDPVFLQEGKKTTWKETPVPSGPVPQFIIDESNEDLQTLIDTLKSAGVVVERPDPLNFQFFNGLYNYCPRDRLLVAGSIIVDTAMMYPCRNMEIRSYNKFLNEADRVVSMPKNKGLILDAANILRINERWLFLESSSGNFAAYKWLCDQFPEVEIELCNFYAGVHIDSTISVLNEGLVVLNASRVNKTNCPRVFDGWTKIWVDDVVAQGFFQYPYASKWIALNMLSIDPKTVIVDSQQLSLIKILEQHGMTVIPLQLRHSRTLGGGFHCVTLDLHRES